MIAVDTNILVYAHRPDSANHDAARQALASLLLGDQEWAIAWPSIHEFLATVSRPRMYADPTPTALAFEQLRQILLPNVRLLQESSQHLVTLERICLAGGVSGPMIHDARIAAICIDHGVSELWTADRDFRRFPGLRLRNPLV